MKTYHCSCGQLIFFHNVLCVNCGRELGFLPDLLAMSDIEPVVNGTCKAAYKANDSAAAGRAYKKCANYTNEFVCNWMLPAGEDAETLCVSCRLNDVIPDLATPGNVEHWARIEEAKRRVIYSLLRLRLPVLNRTSDPQRGLAFRFLADTTAPDGSVQRVMTGHDNGVITLNVDEANDSVRERMRHSMNEPYRTLLGHFRHEIGHYYWDRLVSDTNCGGTDRLEKCRTLFGDERADYELALQTHYANGAPANWQTSFISAYATAHPWEDWAETWAHFLHFHDTMEVAGDFGLVGKKWRMDGKNKSALPPANAFEGFLRQWSELTVALNSINRAMGVHDIYPFVLSQPVIEKLRFVSEVIVSSVASQATQSEAPAASTRPAQRPAAAPAQDATA
jgi:hypothetical protein